MWAAATKGDSIWPTDGRETLFSGPVAGARMSNGEDAADGDDADAAGADDAAGAISTETLDARLADAAEALEAAETEADLDDIEADLDAIAADLEAADLPEPEDDDEDDPAAAVESEIDELRAQLEEARGPYAEDVTDALAAAESTVTEAEWTEDGERDVREAVERAIDAGRDVVDDDVTFDDSDMDSLAESIQTLREAVAAAGLDPDADASTLAELVEVAETLTDDLEAAEIWSDLTIRERLYAQGFYDVLEPENTKDFPPAWNAIKVYAQEGEAEPILMALEYYESDFMEENILDALERFAPAEAVEPMEARAERRDKHAIQVLGRIGDDRPRETIEDLLGGGDVQLDIVCLRALGAIGSAESTQAVADRLVAESASVRSAAARALGMIGDTRAVDPLSDVLADDEANEVRASAAWALNQIGTERALDIAADYADDRSYIVQSEAENAAGV